MKARNEKGDLTERKTSCDKRKNLATSKYLLSFPLQLKLESVFTFSLGSRYSIVVAITTAVSTATTASGIQNRHRFPFSYAFAVSLASIPPSSESQRQRAASEPTQPRALQAFFGFDFLSQKSFLPFSRSYHRRIRKTPPSRIILQFATKNSASISSSGGASNEKQTRFASGMRWKGNVEATRG